MDPQSQTSHRKVSLVHLLRRVCVAILTSAAFLYGMDVAIFTLRGKPLHQVTVNRYLAVPLKGNKTEYDYEDSQPVACSQSLFPQYGWNPCWYLHRHTTHADKL